MTHESAKTNAMASKIAKPKDFTALVAKAIKNAPNMSIDPCAKLMRFMTPNVKVTPTAIKNKIMPNCRPLKTCSMNNPRDISKIYRC